MAPTWDYVRQRWSSQFGVSIVRAQARVPTLCGMPLHRRNELRHYKEGTIYRVDAKLTMSRRVGRDLLGGLLRLEVKEQDAVADACGVVGLGNLECHEAAIGGDDWIGSFPACIVVEIRKASEVLSGSVEF